MSEQEKTSSLIEESRRVRKGSKRLYWILGIIIAVAPFLFAVFGGNDEEVSVIIEKEKISKGDIILSVSTSGRVIPLSDIDLQFASSGVLKELLVIEGQEVIAGEVIAKLDTGEAWFAVEQARSSLETAEANLLARKVGGTEAEIDLQKEMVTASELSLRVTEADLANKESDFALQITQNERDLTNEYEQALVKMSMVSDVLDTALHIIDTTFGIDSDSVLNGGEDDLSILNSRYRADVDVNYNKADDLYGVFFESLYAQKSSLNRDAFDEFIDQSLEVSKSVNKAVEVGLSAIESSIATGKLSQSTIDSLISSFQTQQNKVKDEVLVITQIGQDITELHIEGEEALIALNQDVRDLQLKVESAEQNITIAQAQLNLKTDDVSSDVLAPYRAQVTQAQVSVDLALKKYNDLILKSPISGEIVELNYRVGEVVGGEPVAVVSSAQGITVEVYVEEADVAGIEEGQEVVLTFDALEDVALIGSVTFISSKSTIDSNGIVTYKVMITGVDTNEKVREGMTTYADIVSSGVRDVLVVPVATVKPRDGKPSVQLEDGTWVPVVTGFTDGKSVEVISGIKRGDTIMYER